MKGHATYVDSEILDATKNKFLDYQEIYVEPIHFKTRRRLEATMVLPGGSQRYEVSASSSDKIETNLPNEEDRGDWVSFWHRFSLKTNLEQRPSMSHHSRLVLSSLLLMAN